LLFLALAVEIGLLASSRIPWSSDQAIVGLMARHILEGRGHPVFYYGATYAGSLEAHGVAAVFAVFGPTRAAYAGAMAALALAIAGGTALVARRAFGSRAAFVALGYLAVPPFFFLYKALTSDGAYDSVALVAIGHLLTALAIEARAAAGRSVLAPVVLLGCLAGLGLWVTPACLPLTAAAVAWVAGRRLVRLRAAGPFVSGAALGALPWFVWNARHGWASLRAAEAGRVDLAGFFANAKAFVLVSLPILAGAARPNHEPGSPEEPFSGASVLAPLLLLLLLAPVFSRLNRDPHVALLVLTLLAVTGAALLSQRFTSKEPRYLMAAYVIVPPLLGAAAKWWLAARRRARVALGAALLLLVTHVGGYARAYVHGPVVNDAQVTGPLDELAATLKRLGVRRVWASYWTSYRLAFETGEEILASPLPAEDVVRLPGYAAAVKAAPDAAVVLLPPRTACFATWLDERGVTAVRTRAGAFTIFSSLPMDVLGTIARGDSLPLPSSAERVSWRLLSATPAPDGRAVTVEAELRNEGPCVFTHAVSIVASTAAFGGPWSADTDTHLPNTRVAPGEAVRVRVSIPQPAASPGARVRLRLVHRATGLFPHDGTALVVETGKSAVNPGRPEGDGREPVPAGAARAAGAAA
jgi:hypothetical protein